MWRVKFVELTILLLSCIATPAVLVHSCHITIYLYSLFQHCASLNWISNKSIVFRQDDVIKKKKEQASQWEPTWKLLKLKYHCTGRRGKKTLPFYCIYLNSMLTISTSTAKRFHFHICTSLIIIRTDGWKPHKCLSCIIPPGGNGVILFKGSYRFISHLPLGLFFPRPSQLALSREREYSCRRPCLLKAVLKSA